MSADVFISHSNKDKTIAEAICHRLEANGIRCWIAPRDIQFGSDWTEGITQGITSCKVFVLVFSDSANTSDHVRREVAKAFSLGLAVIPFRTEDVAPNRSLSYFLETVHWLDAFPSPTESYFGTLTDQIKRLLEQPAIANGSSGKQGLAQVAVVTAPAEIAAAQTVSRLPTSHLSSEASAKGEARHAPQRPKKPNGLKKTLVRFNLVFLPILAAAIGATSAIVHNSLQDGSQQQVVSMAKVMLETARASRKYTTDQIAPLLETLQPSDQQFHPQSIPFYAATEAFNYFRQTHPDFAYKEAAPNPTNPRDRTVDWEADIVNEFRNDTSKKELIGRRDTPLGPSLFISTPIKVDDASCLQCHSTPDKAPPGMVKLYGSANGFGWQSGDVVGAQIVSVPAALTEKLADNAFQSIFWWLIGIGIVVFGVTNGVLLWALRSAQRIADGR
jgi:protein-histidine pros-kinase